MNFTNKFYLEALNLDAYKALNLAIFIKDTQSKYLWANDFFIYKAAGFQSLREVYNKKDEEFVWCDYAKELQGNDELLFEKTECLNVRERVLRYDGSYTDIISQKSPLFDKHQKLIGLIGFSVALPVSKHAQLLSKREYAAVVLMSEGYTDKEIAKKWNVSPRTVESYLLNAKQKLGVKSRAQLIVQICHENP